MKKFYQSSLILLVILFLIPITSKSETIEYGESILASLDVEGEHDLFTFEGQDGDRVMMRMRDASSGVDACIKLYSPDMNLLAEHCGYGGDVEIFNYVIESSGTYNIMVSDRNDNDTGLYGLSLELLNPDPENIVALACGETVLNEFDQVVDCDAYNFHGTQGERAYFQIRSEGTGVESEMMLFDGEGNLLETKIARTNSSTSITGFQIPVTGWYTLFCLDKNGNDVGAYELSFAKTGDENCVQFIGCDETMILGNLEYKTSINIYSLKAPSAQNISIKMFDKGIHMEPLLDLYAPNGEMMDNGVGYTFAEVGGMTAEEGFYQIVAMDDNANNLGTYALTIEGGIFDTETEAVCNDVVLQLGADGTASISAEQISSSISGACGIMSMNLDRTDFNCADIGTHTVTLTISDGSGSLYTDQGTITIEDPEDNCSVNMCDIQGLDTQYEWIEKVVSYEMTNQSGNDQGYGDYTNLISLASPGGTMKLLLEPGSSSTTGFKEYWSIWIDLNEDGDFDESEWLFAKRKKYSIYAYVPIPEETSQGLKTMRIIMSYQGYEDPCGTFEYGEAEDYLVNVVGEGPDSYLNENPKLSWEESNTIETVNPLGWESASQIENRRSAKVKFSLYPNPVTDILNLEFENILEERFEVQVYSQNGQFVLKTPLYHNGDNKIQINLLDHNLASGNYNLKVVTESGFQDVQQFVVIR